MRYTYKHLNPVNSSENSLVERDGQPVVIIRAIFPPERDAEAGRMYEVRFPDGFRSAVFADELVNASGLFAGKG